MRHQEADRKVNERSVRLTFGLSSPCKIGLRSGRNHIAAWHSAQLCRPHVVDVLLERIGVGLQLRLCTLLCSGNGRLDPRFDVGCRDHNQSAGSVIEQLAEVLEIRTVHSTGYVSGHSACPGTDCPTTEQAGSKSYTSGREQ